MKDVLEVHPCDVEIEARREWELAVARKNHQSLMNWLVVFVCALAFVGMMVVWIQY